MTVKHIFIKFHEKNEDYPNVASTMEEHAAIAAGNANNEFGWGQFTTKKNVSGISKQHKAEIEVQLDSGITTYVYFYSRVGQVLYRAKLEEIYDGNSPKVVQPAFTQMVPAYYRHLCGETQITESLPSVVYSYFRVCDLELLATGKEDLENVAREILHYAKQEPILTIGGMQALLYVSDEGLQPHLTRIDIEKARTSISNKQVKIVTSEDQDEDMVDNEDPSSSTTRKVDHAEANKNKHANGLIAELLVLKIEKDNLILNGRSDLAEQIVHVSVENGDGDGYDILSYDLAGNPKYIEVKGTKNKKNVNFFVTAKEVQASKEHEEQYYLYRVFDLEADVPSLKIYQGKLEKHFALQNYTYIAKRK